MSSYPGPGPYGAPFPHYSQYQQGQQPIPNEDRTAATLAHVSTLIAMVISAGWLSFVGPLVIWFLYKDRSSYVRRAAAGAFNFNLWANIAMIVGWILTLTVLLAWIGIPLMIFATIAQLWCHIRGALRAWRGEDYSYRYQLRILN